MHDVKLKSGSTGDDARGTLRVYAWSQYSQNQHENNLNLRIASRLPVSVVGAGPQRRFLYDGLRDTMGACQF